MENGLVNIPNENVFLEFAMDNQIYAVFSNDEELTDESQIYLAKVDYDNNIKIFRNIETDEEYNRVIIECNRIIDTYMEDEEDV